MHNFAKVFITGLQTPCSQGCGVVLFCISASRFSTVGGLWVPQAEILSPALLGTMPLFTVWSPTGFQAPVKLTMDSHPSSSCCLLPCLVT